MRYPWANILIGVALTVSVVTGFLTLTSNHSPFLGDIHAAASLAVVAVFWWKAWNIRGGLRQWRRRPASTAASITSRRWCSSGLSSAGSTGATSGRSTSSV